MTDSHLRRAYLALFVGILCIGLSAIWVKLAGVPGTVSAFYRMAIAALVLVPLWLARRGPRSTLPRGQALQLALLGGVFFAMDLSLWNTAILMTSAAQATLLTNSAPLWVGLGALIFFHERLRPLYWVGLAIALAGMLLVVRQPAAAGPAIDVGSLLPIAASMFYAAYLLSTQRARATTDTVTFMVISVLASAAVLLALNLVLGQPLSGFPPKSWAALLGLALISHVGGWLSINYALGHLPATRVSVSLLGQPLVTTLVAIPLLGEIPTPRQVLGAVLVLAGIYTVLRSRQS